MIVIGVPGDPALLLFPLGGEGGAGEAVGGQEV